MFHQILLPKSLKSVKTCEEETKFDPVVLSARPADEDVAIEEERGRESIPSFE